MRASKFIIGQFHIAASRNNSTFNIQKSKLRSAPPCAKNIFVLSALFVFKKIQSDIRVQKSRVPHVSAPPRTKIREIGEIRVQDKNIRVIRVITSLRSVGLRRISCSKHLVRASKFIIGQFHIAASRNNSTFNIQNSTLRSAPPCAINIRLILL